MNVIMREPSFEELVCVFSVAAMLVISPIVVSLSEGAQFKSFKLIADETNAYLETNNLQNDIFIPREFLGHGLILFLADIKKLLKNSRQNVTFEEQDNKRWKNKPAAAGNLPEGIK